MPERVALRLLDNIDTSTPFRTRVEFIELLAALATRYPDEMNRKVTGANKPVKDVLWSSV